jgi:predicted nucleotidyltransferase
MGVTEQREELGQIYGVSQYAFSSAIDEGTDRSKLFQNTYNFFTNPTVMKLMKSAKTDGVFSRAKRPNSAFAKAVGSITSYMTRFSEVQDFSNFEGYDQLNSALEEHVERNLPSKDSKIIRKGLEKAFSERKEALAELQMYPLVFGSVKYGDASERSDVDVVFLVGENGCNNQRAAGDEFYEVEAGIEAALKNKNQIKDINTYNDAIVRSNLLQGILTDIVEEATDGLEDYNFSFGFGKDNKAEDMFPYSWILEGYSPINGLGEIEETAKEIRKRMLEAVKVDPFFELMISIGMYAALQKRQKKLSS